MEPAAKKLAADLLIVGGHVIDPANAVDGPADVAVTGGRVAEVGQGLAAK